VEVWVDTVRVEVALPPEGTDTLEGLSDKDSPAGEELAERFTVPENALIELTVIVEVPLDPALTAKLAGLAEREKSGVDNGVTVTETWAEWLREPEVPETVTV
jgi:hypothetical protein